MERPLLKKALIWGTLLWAFGYLLGIVLFMAVPTELIGWIITPIGTAAALWVLLKKFTGKVFRDYFAVGFIWTAIAIALDYFLLVKLFNPPDGYYKFDVYLYYFLTFTLPILVGWKKSSAISKKTT
jgi:hypothetical protein